MQVNDAARRVDGKLGCRTGRAGKTVSEIAEERRGVRQAGARREWLADQVRALRPREFGARQIDFDNDSTVAHGHVSDWRKVVEIRVASNESIEPSVRLEQLAILHFELDLVHTELSSEIIAFRVLHA